MATDPISLALETVQWGPVISILLTAAIGIVGVFVRTVTKTLGQHGIALAVLISETRPGLKLTSEVLDLKLASAELNVVRLDIERRMTSLELARDRTR